MFREKSLAAYKGRPAVVSAVDDKISITLAGETLKVREKDIELIHEGPLVLSPAVLAEEAAALDGDLRGAWELLEAEPSGAAQGLSLKELAELVYGEYSPVSAWAAYCAVKEGLYFSGTARLLRPRPREDVERDEGKKAEKEKESAERGAFLKRVQAGALQLPGDRRFLQDIEALALGKTDKSRTLRDLGRSETPQEAHRLLLGLGVWTVYINPYPSRFGITGVKASAAPPPEEERVDLSGLDAYAIDNEWSNDPDDAVSIDGNTLYVHVADPASALYSGSPADLEARGRGATLYLPEGSRPMLGEDALPLYALGLAEISPALTFKLRLNDDASIADTAVFPSLVRVSRLSYARADALLAAEEEAGLKALAALALRNRRRREAAGAVMIEMPEVHIRVELPGALGGNGAENTDPVNTGAVHIAPLVPYQSAELVKECMLLAGEGAAQLAVQKRLPFPFVSQEAGELPSKPLPGMAGSYQLRRCMRPRLLSAKPGAHSGLGLSLYTQVTSPLRRYTDLLAHQQLRALLSGGAPLSGDEVLLHLAAGEAAAAAVHQAERASLAHWTAVYCAAKKDSLWEAVLLEKKGERWAAAIPALGLETQVSLRGEFHPNDTVSLTLKSADIPSGEIGFSGG